MYDPKEDSSRRYLWEELVLVIASWNLPGCIRGDFNVTWFSSERLGREGFMSTLVKFSDFIAENRLVDILLSGEGGIFT